MHPPSGLARFRTLAVATTAATLILTTVGALVRATNSGLGCLDEWPKCRGGWIAPLEYTAVIEYSHRALAGVVVLLLVALVITARRWVRDETVYFRLAAVGLSTVIFQALIGREVVTSGLHAALVTAHLVAALALVAIVTTITSLLVVHGRAPATGSHLRVASMSLGAVIALVPVLVAGAYVREKGAGLAFPDWPLMGGRLLPSFSSTAATIHFAHRLLVLLVAAHIVVLAVRARRDSRGGVRLLALGGVGLYLGQAFVGALNVWTDLAALAVLAHASVAFITWACFVALTVVARRGRIEASGDAPPAISGGGGMSERVMAYVRLTKPRIITLLLITTVPAMVLAERGIPSLALIGATLLGGMLTAGSANAFNQYLERDIDVVMERTKKRPLPAASVEPARALAFAIVLGVVGFIWLWVVVNLLSAILAVSAIAFYVIVYTVLLKRNTPQNIVIGGAAGAAPVLIGWSAVTNTVGLPAWVMFAIVFLWTPPHFWALAMRYKDDYAAAGVPMLPVVRTQAQTTFQILMYSVVLVATTLLMSPVGGLGVIYAATAVTLGVGFIWRAIKLRWNPTGQAAFGLFKYSVSYLAILFAAIAVDRLVW